MSIEHALNCYERFNSDPEFSVAIAGSNSKENSKRVAQDAGFYFTKDEWDTVVASSSRSKSLFGSAGRAGCHFPNECKG